MAFSGDSSNDGSGLFFRISKLYNNDSFSDLEFLVKDQSGFKTFKAHKLIFATASKEFASRLYNNDDSEMHQIMINDFSPQTFQLVLQYLYTDKLDLKSIKEAIDVYKLCSKYGIKELLEKCENYIGQNLQITGDNIFHMYEMALKENIGDILTRCRVLVCSNTRAIFSSVQFREAPVEVLEDILKQDSLSVEKEIEVIDAVLLWCKKECVMNGQPLDAVSIRKSINPLLPYLRFLTLSGEDFCDFVEQNRIFSSPETALLTRKIFDPDGTSRIPLGFCCNSRPRGTVTESSIRKDTAKLNLSKLNGNVPAHRTSLTGVGRQQSCDESSKVTKPPLLVTSLSTTNDSQSPMQAYSSHQNGIKDENQSKSAMPLFQFTGTAAKKPPLLKERPPQASIQFNPQRMYDFNLLETPNAMGSVSRRDLICSAEIQVSRGSMVIYGVHLKILNSPKHPNENISVCLSLSGDFPQTSNISSEKLSNDMIHLRFSEPLKLASSNSAKIQITVEDLKLRRCLVCKTSRWELNSGLNLNAMINLKSNQTNETEEFFFLISRLIYS